MKFPPISAAFNDAQQSWLRDLIFSIRRELTTRVSRVEPQELILLSSPSKKIYEVKVDDAGAISATLVQE